MPLIKAPESATVVVEQQSYAVLLGQLGGSDPDERRHAARALASESEAAPALAAQLQVETDPVVRDAIFSSLAEIGGDTAANAFAGLLRSADAGLRGGAIEGLKRLETDAVATVDTLLDDPDPDVRLLVIEVTRTWPCQLAVPRLRRLIENDPHVNVCGAAVEVATEVGTRDLLEPLAELRARFEHETFLHFAIDIARDRIDATTDRGA